MVKQIKKEKRSPTLNTILMVETTLKNAKSSVIKVSELKRRLPKQINHNVLKKILFYLEESNKIVVSLKGITWVSNNSEKIRLAIKNGFEYPEDFSK